MYSLAKPFLFALDAEKAHDLGLEAMQFAYRTGTSPLLARNIAPLPRTVFGIEFKNPVGLAAGLDKNGAYIDALAALGFGFIEVGTTTPKPQQGNPKPRMFRLPEHEAVINRLGFNNAGVDALVKNAEAARFTGVLGINIGKNKDTPNEKAADDYLICLRKVYARASYVTVNISSPNTENLRDLQQGDALAHLISALRNEQEKLASIHGKRTPMLLKIAPDLNQAELDSIAEICLTSSVDGVICTNTTIDRTAVASHLHSKESGGLSGKPLMVKSTQILQEMAKRIGSQIPLIGVGGITCGKDAATKISAGASLVQFYSGMIYRGPSLIRDSVEAIRLADNKHE